MTLRAYALLILTTLIWAGNSIAGKIGVGHIDPILLTTLRWTFATLVILPFAWPRLKADWPIIRQHLWLLLAYGATGFGLFNVLLYTALTHTQVVNVMIEQSVIPILIFGFSFALFRTKATVAQVIGAVLTLAGVLATASEGQWVRLMHLQLNIGDAFMLTAGLIYAGYTVALRWKPGLHWLSLLSVQCVGAVLACLPFMAWHGATTHIAMPDATGWGVVAYAALLPSLAASAAYIAAVDMIGANRAGLFVNLLPIFGVGLSVVILRAQLHPYHFAALGLVCLGIVLSEWGRTRVAQG